MVEVEYPINELIKCCGQYPVYRTNQGVGTSWLECECCRRRTYHDYMVKTDANVEWNILMLRQRDPRDTVPGKVAILSLIDYEGMSHQEIADILGLKETGISTTIIRMREEIKEEYGDNSEDRQSGEAEGNDNEGDSFVPGFG